MKKLYFFLAGILLTSIAYAGYSDPTYQEAHKVNNTAYNQKEPYRAIKLVRFSVNTDNSSSTSEIASGDAVVYSVQSADGVSVRKSTASADGAFAGIACTAIQTGDAQATIYRDDAGRRNWGYIVVTGIADAGVTAGGTNGNAFGDIFIISTDAGKITGAIGKTLATGITSSEAYAYVRGKGGFFLQSADGSSTSVKVFVQAQ